MKFIFVLLKVNRGLGQILILLGSGTLDTCHEEGVTWKNLNGESRLSEGPL